MRSISRFSLFLLLPVLAACTEKQSLPEMMAPQPISVPSGKPAIGPRLAGSGDTTLVLSWMEPGESGGTLFCSAYKNGDWLPAAPVIADDNLFINWADLPAVTPVGSRHLFAHWMSKVADSTYAYQVLSAFSVDAGKSWTAPARVHTDQSATEHGFLSVYTSADNSGMLWLDGRETPDAGMTLRAASLDSGGAPVNEQLVDDLVCDCCQTDVVVADSGPVAVYRDRTTDEIRDISVARLQNGQWQPGMNLAVDGWEISGCPVNGPGIDAIADQVVVAWFTAAGDKPTVKIATSSNGGKEFSAPTIVATRDTIGHVNVAMIDKHSFVVSWMETDKDNSYEINLRAMTFDGQKSRKMIIGRTSLSRIVPQMARIGDELVFAWTDQIRGLNKIATVKMKILGYY